jgi:hypothetical protein
MVSLREGQASSPARRTARFPDGPGEDKRDEQDWLGSRGAAPGYFEPGGD